MLLLADHTSPEFYLVQGCETGMPGQLMSGNVPSLGLDLVSLGLLVGLGLFLWAAVLVALARRAEGRGRLKPSWARFADVAVCVGFFLAWEAMLRGSPFVTREAFVPDPLTFWKANPQLLSRAQAANIGVVGLGQRMPQVGIFDKDHLGPKPPGVYRIIFMGDSQAITSGRLGYAGPVSYPKVVESSLRLQGLVGPQGQAVEVINAGISGFSSWQGLMLLRSDLLPLEPDVVVAAFGYHDANRAISSDHEVLTDSRWTWLVRTLMYRSRLCLLLRSLILHAEESWEDQVHAEGTRLRVPPAQFGRNLEAFAEQGRRHAFRLVFLSEPISDPLVEEHGLPHRRAMLRVAASLGVPVIDGWSCFHGLSPAQRKAWFQDAIHMTRDGHARMAALVLRRLVQCGLLTRRLQGRVPAPGEGPAAGRSTFGGQVGVCP